ncbi:MAG: NUDIX hydrolase [Ignavibacteria bacterium]|nr:NUDIX hydrolase [Ignavibacteria bacterium]
MLSDLKDAVIIIIEKDCKYLFVKKSENTQGGKYWAPVSGRVENNETQEEAVIRETFEEVGLKVTPNKKEWECKSEYGNYILHWWSVEIISGIESTASDEISEVKWVTLNEMKKLKPVFKMDIEYFEQKELLS